MNYRVKLVKIKERGRLQTEVNTLNQTLSTYNSQLTTLNSQISSNQSQINSYNTTYQNSERTRINNLISVKNQELLQEQAFIDGQESKMQSAVLNDLGGDVKTGVADVFSTTLNTTKGGTLFVAGTAYQVVDSSLFNAASTASLVMGTDINKINSYPFQLGRQTGNNTVMALSLLAVAGGSGTAAGATAVAVSGTGLCAATLAGGGVMLVPCAVSVSGATTVAGAGVAVATYGGVTYSLSSKNQGDISNAVKNAANSSVNSSIKIEKGLGGSNGWGLVHLLERHMFGTPAINASKFSKGMGEVEITNIIKEAINKTTTSNWRTEGLYKVIEVDMGRLIGNNIAGKGTNVLRIVTKDGSVTTAYPF